MSADCAELFPTILSTLLLFTRDFGALFARFGKADRNGLLSAFHSAAFATFPGFKSSTLSSAHSALYALLSALAVSRHHPSSSVPNKRRLGTPNRLVKAKD